MTRLARLLALGPVDRRIVVLAWAATPIVRVTLRALGFRRCRAILGALSDQPWSTPGDGAEAARVARLVRAAARHGAMDRHCLTESLVLWWLLRRRGIESEIRIGVRKDGGTLDAHAWVEWDGGALDEQPDVARTFPPLVRSTAG